MPLNIKDEETHRRAKELAAVTETSLTEAVDTAISEALERRRVVTRRMYGARVEALREIALETARLPVRDDRSAEEILGYDGNGVPR